MTDGRKSWHRDGIPAWGWFAIIVMRLFSLVVALLPVLLLVAGVWWWNHGGAKRAPKVVQQAVAKVQSWVGAALGK